MKTLALAAVLILALPTTFVHAQNIQYNISFMDMDGSSYARHLDVKNVLEEVLESRGAQQNPTEGWLFLVGVSEPNEESNIALSITVLHKLPENIVQMGKSEEVFYKSISDQDPQQYPEEGKWVREYMSEEYMRQFVMAQGNYVEIVPSNELRESVTAIVDKFYERHVHRGEE